MDSVLLAGKYKILNKLGRGGFGTVFEVIDLSSGKHYAVKMVCMRLVRKRLRMENILA